MKNVTITYTEKQFESLILALRTYLTVVSDWHEEATMEIDKDYYFKLWKTVQELEWTTLNQR